MVKLNKQMTVQIEAKTVDVSAKVCDSGLYWLKDQNEVTFVQVQDYVPSWFPGEHYGDYLDFTIDLETGQILNWKPPTAEDLEMWMEETGE